jgi:hypothetical protein
VQVRFGEVPVERLAVSPFLDGDEAQRILDGREEAVSETSRLTPRIVLHSLEPVDELVPLLGTASNATYYHQHT